MGSELLNSGTNALLRVIDLDKAGRTHNTGAQQQTQHDTDLAATRIPSTSRLHGVFHTQNTGLLIFPVM
jgi:hypothetical protein